jgi:predicted transcriptional regulator
LLSTLDLLERAKAAAGGASDYRIAQLLGVPRTTVSNYRNGVTRPENPIAMRLADLCGLDPVEVVASVNLERAKSETDRELWEMILKRCRPVKASKTGH